MELHDDGPHSNICVSNEIMKTLKGAWILSKKYSIKYLIELKPLATFMFTVLFVIQKYCNNYLIQLANYWLQRWCRWEDFLNIKLSGNDWINKGFGAGKPRSTYFIEIAFKKDNLME
jgi:hypothetical protein